MRAPYLRNSNPFEIISSASVLIFKAKLKSYCELILRFLSFSLFRRLILLYL